MSLIQSMVKAQGKIQKLLEDMGRVKAPEGSPQSESKSSMQRVAPMFSNEEVKKIKNQSEELNFFYEQMKDILRS